MARVFDVLHKQGTFNKSVGEFLKQKVSSFIQLIILLSEQNDKYIECLDSITTIGQARDVIANIKDNQGFWNKVSQGNIVCWLLEEVLA